MRSSSTAIVWRFRITPFGSIKSDIAAALKYCRRDADPSLGVRNVEPKPRQAVWNHGEVIRLCKTAWRAGNRGLAVSIAVAWDTSLSPSTSGPCDPRIAAETPLNCSVRRRGARQSVLSAGVP
jgi:hypothetical protein